MVSWNSGWVLVLPYFPALQSGAYLSSRSRALGPACPCAAARTCRYVGRVRRPTSPAAPLGRQVPQSRRCGLRIGEHG